MRSKNSTRRLVLARLALCLALIGSVVFADAQVSHELSPSTAFNASSGHVERALAPKKKTDVVECSAKKPAKQALAIDMTSGTRYKASIAKAREQIKKVQYVNDKKKVCNPISGWTLTVAMTGENPVSVPLGDDVYMLFPGAKVDYPPTSTWTWTYAEFVKGIKNPRSPSVHNAYVIAESVRFDWVMNRIAKVLDMDRSVYPSAGFKMPKDALLNKWGNFGKPIGQSESEAKKALDSVKFVEAWNPADLPVKK